ncbi:MAG: ABC transporter permease subunit [Clostridiales bacterium]|jgi:NitT/TauT family transport system permease protein|nr:ABC transporter permease subunit [Clostridiales bacterium]
MIKKIFNIPNLLFAAAVATAFAGADFELKFPAAYLAALAAFEIAFIYRLIRAKTKITAALDLYSVVFGFFLLWDLSVKVFKVLPYNLLPPPQNVFHVFTVDYADMLNGFFQSMYLIIVSVGLGMGFGIFFGLFVGWHKKAREAISPIINLIAAVPALVYAPYIVAIAPTFRSASIIVIFMGIFFPTMINMVSNVQNVGQKLIDSARSLNLSDFSILIKVLLPECAIPLLGSLRIRIATAFMILTMAETIGADAGLGYYVKRWVAWSDYTKTFAGIILIAVVVTAINALIGLFERKALIWVKSPN